MYVLLGFLQKKNMGDPYYEPTIVVHDNGVNIADSEMQWILHIQVSN